MSIRLSVEQARADLLAEWVAKHPELVRSIDDITRLPEVRSWNPEILAAAVDANVATGQFVESADGVLIVAAAKR